MIWLVIGAVILYLFGRFFIRREIYKVSSLKVFAYIFFWVASTAMIIVLPNVFIGRSLPKHWMEYENIPLVGFTENGETPYFLNEVSCMGSIGTEKRGCYLYYKKSGRSYYYYEVLIDKTVLHEEDRKDGLLKIYKYGSDKKLYPLIYFSLPPLDEKYEFFIPKDSLSRGD